MTLLKQLRRHENYTTLKSFPHSNVVGRYRIKRFQSLTYINIYIYRKKDAPDARHSAYILFQNHPQRNMKRKFHDFLTLLM